MIAEDLIIELTNKYQTSEQNVRREYFQHLFLSYFYQQPQAVNIFFKGGTALRLLYNSPRFSEDLDFNSSAIRFSEIEQLLLDTLAQMEKENIRFVLKEAKQTTGGFLGIVSFEVSEALIDIQIEISLREGEKKGETFAVSNDFVPPYNVVAVTEAELVSGKVRALLQRKKARDFYDLYFILRSHLSVSKKKELFPQVLDILKKTNINFGRELKQFLPKSHWMIIKDFKLTLEREIGRNN